MIKTILLLITLAVAVNINAQEARKFFPNKYGDICPYRNSYTVGAAEYTEFIIPKSIAAITPENERKLCNNFGVIDASGKLEIVDNFKGNIIIIGFWSTECSPSTKMLEEFKNTQIQATANKLNLVFWPVHFEIWPVVNSFVDKNKSRLGDLTFKKLAVGNNGLSNLTEMLYGLPTVFIIDKKGRIFATWSGFQYGLLITQLNTLLHEK